MKEKNSPIGVHFPLETKILIREKVEEAGVSFSSYIRDLVYKDLELPKGEEGNKVAKLILANRQLEEEKKQLKRENQRLKYEGNFNQEAFEYGNVEIVSPLHIEASKIIQEVL